MGDTIRFDNRFGFPFSRDEYVRAQMLVRSRQEAEAAARGIYDEADPDVIGVHVMDGDLLLLAALSDSLAARVLAYRPKLEDLVRRVRHDPRGFIESWLAAGGE